MFRARAGRARSSLSPVGLPGARGLPVSVSVGRHTALGYAAVGGNGQPPADTDAVDRHVRDVGDPHAVHRGPGPLDPGRRVDAPRTRMALPPEVGEVVRARRGLHREEAWEVVAVGGVEGEVVGKGAEFSAVGRERMGGQDLSLFGRGGGTHYRNGSRHDVSRPAGTRGHGGSPDGTGGRAIRGRRCAEDRDDAGPWAMPGPGAKRLHPAPTPTEARGPRGARRRSSPS